MHPFILLMVLIITNCNCENVEKLLNETTSDEVEGENSRKILGSSVVTSVSVIMDTDNGTKIFTDAVGHQLTKPLHASDVASPIELLNPDRYEFYTFDDNGDLVKRLMTWEEIQEIVASDGDGDGGDYALSIESPTNGVGGGLTPEKRVDDVVNNVQNVVQEEIANQKNQSTQQSNQPPQLDTPDVSDNWSQILPAIFENSGEEISPKPTPAHATPDTIMVEPPMVEVKTLPPTPATTTTTTMPTPSTTEKFITLAPSTVKTLPPSSSPTTTTTTATSPSTTTETIRTEASSTTTSLPIVELTKDNSRPIYHVPGTTTTRPTTTGTTITSTAGTTTTTAATTTTSTAGTTTKSTTEPVPTTLPVKSETTPLTEKMPVPETVLPETTTVLTSTKMAQETTEQDLTTQPTLPITTLLAILRRSTTTTPLISTEIVTENENFSTVSPTTENTKRITTSTEIIDNITTNLPESTEFLKSQETTQQNMESSTSLEDLSTLATEYISTKFDKFLLTSTNIYEINAELAGSKTTTVLPTTTNQEETITDSTTNVLLTTTTQSVPTTENHLIESIEQLISQAIATELVPPPPVPAQAPIDNQDINKKIQDMIMNSSNKTMEIVQNETATVSSDLISNNFNVETTTEPGTITTTEVPQSIDSVLGESFGSILSQVWGNTAEPAAPLESTTTTEYVPHIINITIVRNENLKNQSKPAKADLSLEMEYEKIEEELKKNSSLLSLESVPEQMKIEYNTTTENVESTTELLLSTTTLEAITENTIQNDRPVEPVVVVEINEHTKNETEFNSTTSTWTLVSTILPPISRMTTTTTRQIQEESTTTTTTTTRPPPPSPPINLVYEPLQGSGLEDSTKQLDNDVYEFVQLCNELAFGFWKTTTATLSSTRSVVISPFAATSLLAMVFLGARGATSGEMNDILQLDDMVTFNPHLIFKNISESIKTNNNNNNNNNTAIDGVAISGIIRQLYSDRSKGKLLSFYKDRVRQFYDGHVEEVGFREISDIIRRRTNLLVRRTSNGSIAEFLKDSYIYARPPLAGISTSIFFSDCSSGSISTDNSDGELYFTVTPTLRERRLVPIPAAVWRENFLAGYEPSLDATAAALGTKFDTISTIFVMPGQPGGGSGGGGGVSTTSVVADGLTMLEKHLVESSFKKGAWARLLRSLIPRNGLELQLPQFIHRSILNVTHSFQRMGLHDLFDAKKADLRGLNGGAVHELHLSEMIQINEFGLCGENGPNNIHHREVYPAAVGRRSRLIETYENIDDHHQQQFDDTLHDPSHLDLPLPLRPRQARFPKESENNNNNNNNETPRLRFDRPFLYFVRHNPTGIILHMGRFHPRLL